MKAFEKNIRKVEPYVPGEQPQRKVIKLNTNENPYAPAPGVTKALEEMNTDRLRLYPDPPILSIRYGQICTAFRMNARSLTRTLRL